MKFENYLPKSSITCPSVVNLKDVEKEDLFEILHKCLHLKIQESVGEPDYSLKNKHVVLVTNQRLGLAQLTFRLAIDKVNGHPLTIPIGGSNIDGFLSGRESVEILSKLGIDAFVVETSVADDAEKLSKKMAPVVNAYSYDSPITAIADLLTVYERLKRLDGLNVCYYGTPKYVTSLLAGMAKCGMKINFVTVGGAEPTLEVLNYLKTFTEVTVSENLDKALKECDLLYIDNDYPENYKITKEKLADLNCSACVLHPSPLTEAVDADIDIMDDKRCLVADSGANTVYALSTVLELLLSH